MRFAVDAHAVGQHLTGNEVYIRNLLHGFAAEDRDAEFLTYISKEEAGQYLPARFEKQLVSCNPFRRLGWDIPQALRRDRPDLLHVQYTGPLFCDVPLIVSVHDVSFLETPQFFTRSRRSQLRLTVRRTVERAARVLCPSEFSRQRILDAYRIEEDRVVVMPNAVSPCFRPLPSEAARARIKESFGVTAPFVLTVGDLQPRKNHLGLLRAFADLLASEPDLPHHLVVVGKNTWFSQTVKRAVEESDIAGRVHFTDFVGDDDLLHFYNACDVFVYPSFYEGFGLPIIEAMACGCAVACSNTTAMPEVANAAALLFNPHDEREISLALRDLLVDSELRTRMERKGLQRAGLFSWQRTAQQTLDVYYEVAGGRRPKTLSAAIPQPVSRS